MYSLLHQPQYNVNISNATTFPLRDLELIENNNIFLHLDNTDTVSNTHNKTAVTSISQSTDFGLQFETAYEDAEAFSYVIKFTLERLFDSSTTTATTTATTTTKDSFSYSYSNFLLETSTAECNGLFCEASYTITADVDCGGLCTDNIINEIESTFSEDIENTVSTSLNDGTFLEIFIEVSEDLGSDDLLVVANIDYTVTSSPTAAPTFTDENPGGNFGEIIQFTASVFIIGFIGLIVAIITVMVSVGIGAIAAYLYYWWRALVPIPIPVSEEVVV